MLSCWIRFASLIATWCLSQTKKTPSSVTTSQTAHVPGPQKVQLRSLSLIGLFLISMFYFFQFPQAPPVFKVFLPSFLIARREKWLFAYGTRSAVTCCKLLYRLV